MPETTDVTAESSPAQTAPEAVPNFEPETWSESEQANWMKTGEVPTSLPESTPGEQKPAGDAKADESAEADKPATESAPVVQQEKKGKPKHDADTRKAELHAEIQDLLKQRSDLERDIQARRAAPAESAPAKSDKPKRPVKPVFGEAGHESETFAEYEARQETHFEALTDFKIAEKEAADAQKRSDDEIKRRNDAIEESWKARKSAAEAKHADFAEVAFSKDVPISPTIDAFILRRPGGLEVLYYLGQNVEMAKEISRMEPIEAAYMLSRIEMSLAEPQSIDTPAEPQKPPVIPITKAAKPATNLGATNPAPVDDTRAAVEADDFTRFKAQRDREDIARRKRG